MLCDRLVVMNEGLIVGEGTPAALIAEYAGETVVEVRSFEADVRARATEALHRVGAEVEEAGDTVYGFGLTGAALDTLELEGSGSTLRPANLEDVFLRLAGRALIE